LLTISGATNQIDFYNLEVDITGVTKKGVSVADYFDLIVTNAVNLVSGDLRLVGEAQLVQTHTGLNQNSSVSGKLLKDQQGASSTFAYNYWSSPVNNNTGAFSLNGGLFDGTDSAINPFTPQQILFNSGSPYNGVPAILDGSNNVLTPLYISDRWLYTYSPNTLGYAGWDKINKDSQIAPGVGFTMKGTGMASQNYVFKGVPNDGDYIFPIVNGESALIGNPYPSAIDSDKFITDNLLLLDKLLFWVDGGSNSHNLSDYLGGYSIYNLTGGVSPSVISSISGLGTAESIIPKRYMAIGQGFFVEATETGSILFDNSQRFFKTEDGINSNFYKISGMKNKEAPKSSIANSYIRIGYEDPEMFHRQLLLGFLPEAPADLGFNPGYDALMIDPREDELFYIIENDLTKKYVIQGVGAYDDLYVFPISLIMTQVGTHTIMLDNVENFSDTVYIKDTVLNITHNLSESSFNPNLPPGEYHDRFQIVFQPETLNQDNLNKKDISVYYNKNSGIIINNKNQLFIQTVLIYNMVGQKIIQLNNNALRETKIEIPFNYSEGFYLVKIETNRSNETFKILKY
jgi:hypothetical protein